MNVVLVNAPSEKGRYEHEHLAIPKIGLCYMTSFLEKNGVDCGIVDAKFEHLDFEETIRRVVEKKPDVVGLSGMTPEINSAAQVAGEVKKRIPGVTVIIGGAHAIAIPEQTLEEFGQFDMLAIGEGEYTILELIRALETKSPLEDVKGLLLRSNGRLSRTPPREWIEDLDSLPFPAWQRFPKRPPFHYILSSRGCPHHCTFCMTVLGKRFRARSPENVIREIQWLVDTQGMRNMIFLDESFALIRKRTDRMMELMIDQGLHRKVSWVAQTRADTVDRELCEQLKRAGCTKIEFGIESGNPEILKSIRKNINLEQAFQAVRVAKRAGLKTGCSFILGHPNETEKTMQDTIDFIVRQNSTIISVGIMVPHPGTVVYEMAVRGEGGYRITSRNWSDYVKFGGGALELLTLSQDTLRKYQAKAYLSLYLKNYRFLAFFLYAWEHRAQAAVAARKLVAGRLSAVRLGKWKAKRTPVALGMEETTRDG